MRSIGRFVAFFASLVIAFGGPLALASNAAASDYPTPNPSQSEDCIRVAPGTVNGKITYGGGIDVAFDVSINKKVCKDDAVQVAFANIYQLPDTYDGSGNWNASAGNQPSVANTTMIVLGGNNTATATLSVFGKCGWFQADLYKGPYLDYVTYPAGHSKNGYITGKIFKINCAPKPPVVMPEAFAGSICEIGQSSAVVHLVNVMSEVGGKFVVTTSDGRKFVEQLAAGTDKELMFTYEGTVIIMVKAIFGEDVYEILEQELTDEGCVEPPIVVGKPKASIADAKCVAGYPGASIVTLDNTKSDASSSFEVRGSNGFRVIIMVKAGQIEKIKVPLAEDKSVTVTITDTRTGKVLAQRSLSANCQNDAKPPTTSPKPPELADTGAGDVLMTGLLGAVLVVIGVLPFIRRKKVSAI
jgi:hypothetical protein